jgi:hypothetical protein
MDRGVADGVIAAPPPRKNEVDVDTFRKLEMQSVGVGLLLEPAAIVAMAG